MTYRANVTRRTMLKGAGVMMGLPWLEAMADAPAGSTSPIRLATLYMPNGVFIPNWTPKGVGKNYKLSPSLSPLGDLKAKCSVFTGLRNTPGLLGDGHYAKTASWLTGSTAVRTGGKNIRAGISFDQLAAQTLGSSTPLATFDLGIDPVHTVVDMGYSTVYGCHVSWRTPTMPALKEIRPQAAFDRLFRSSDANHQSAAGSVLDVVREDAKGLRQRISGEDRRKLDEYFDAVRAVEERLARIQGRSAAHALAAAGELSRRPEPDPKDFAAHCRVMLDLIALSFWTDSTRVSSFMFGNDVSGRDFSFVDGVKGGFHPLSHHELDKDKQRQYSLINQWHIAQVAYLLRRLDSLKEGERTLLDNSLVLFGSSISDGNAHSPFDVPTLLAGSAGGRIKTGEHHSLILRPPLTNLFVSLLRVMGRPTDRFGDSTSDFDKLILAA